MSARDPRILMTVDAVGGVWQYGTDLARGLATLGIETILALLGPSPSAAALEAARRIPGTRFIRTGLPLEWLAENPEQVTAAGDRIAELAAREGADLVHLNTPALAAHSRFPMPVIAVAHSCVTSWWAAVKGGRPDLAFRWRGELTGRGLRAARLVVAPSLAFARMTQDAHHLLVTPTVVHNGRSLRKIRQAATHDLAFTAGRLWDEGKNVATLDRAAARLAVPLHAAGPLTGPNGTAITLHHAHPLGMLEEPELARWLAARPVFASAALYEPFGLAVLEAAMARCSLVLSDIPTFRELWEGAALFVDPSDDRGFARAITKLIGDGMRRAQMGAQARERASALSVEAMAEKMAAIYRSLCQPCLLAAPGRQVAA